MAQARSGDEFVWAELDPDPIRTVIPNSSTPQNFDHIEDRNLSSYTGILRQGRSSFEPAMRIPYQRWR